jgi:Phage tail tube protein, GTA-gp10
MPNPRRGEVELTLDGRRYTLCLTFGALAELEAAFGAADLGALAQRFSQGSLSAGDIIAMLSIAIRGGGEHISDEEVRALPLAAELPSVIAALATLLEMTFLGSTRVKSNA